MALPRIEHPLYDLTIPSSGKEIKIRPFTVKEEKIVLMTTSTPEEEQEFDKILSTVIQIIRNCIVTEDVEVENLAIFDLEYIFIRLRAISVDNIVELTYSDKENGKYYKFNVDLDKVEIDNYDKDKAIIQLSDEVGIKLRYPAISDLEFLSSDIPESDPIQLIKRFLIQIYDSDNVYVAGTDFDEKELDEFIESLQSASIQKINEFFVNLPSISYKTTIKTGEGDEDSKEIELRGLADFFM